MKNRLSPALICFTASTLLLGVVLAQTEPGGKRGPRKQRDSFSALDNDPFKGITAGGKLQPGLFSVKATGVSTEPMRQAASAFVAGLTDEQRKRTLFPVEDSEWRKWDNRHFASRQGTGFFEMTDAQRKLAHGLLSASLSAKGHQQATDIMNLNGTLGELTGNLEEYSESFYWITIMGEPSATKPWGWQLDGHHCIVNYFVLGDQVVMTPTFMGTEPIKAEGGKFKGTIVLQAEQDKGLALMQALDAAQQAKATIRSSKGPTDNVSEAYKDNIALDYAGIRASELTVKQKQLLLEVVAAHVGNMDDAHARVKMEEVKLHLSDTYFGWIGSFANDGVFYYRIHSPVVLVEFDHQKPIALGRSNVPTRNHVHTVVRTPNGNDYGKDLLRLHLASQKH
jgi:hypothetical protein